MGVGVNDAVERIDPGIEQLFPQVRRGVDEHACGFAFHQALHKNRRPAAAVARIIRIARTPAPGQGRHTPCSAAAENGDL